MPQNTIFTYVSPTTCLTESNKLCQQLPITARPVSTVEELFPLLSDPTYHTDFVCISIEMFYQREDALDVFDIIHTLNILIKSTVYRPVNGKKPEKRKTKIFVIVDETTDPKLVKEVMQFPSVVTVGWILKKQEDYQSVLEYITRIIEGDFSHHPKVLDMVKPKKKTVEKKKDTITLTVRQAQVLQLVQTRGASNKTIARMLGLTESTVKLHMGAILKKYGVKNRTQLAVFSMEH
jgi:DNA-binding CsgD family transcriptional regulator